MRVVLDTNVWISGIFWSGPPEAILKAWKEQVLSLIISLDILAEHLRVSDLLAKKYPAIDLKAIMAFLMFHSELYTPGPLMILFLEIQMMISLLLVL